MFSLICTVYNEQENIESFLDSYLNQSLKADEFIIVDGGSTDDTVKILERFSNTYAKLNIRIIVDSLCNKKHSSAPISRGRNVAIKNTRHEIIVTTDAGCTLDPFWFETLIKPYLEKESNILCTGGVYESITTTDFSVWYSRNFMPKEEDFKLSSFLPSSRNFSFRKELWEKVDGYPLGSFAGEDTKFVLDILKLGVDIKMTDALVLWECPRDIEEARVKHFNYALGDGFHKQYYGKYFFSTLKLPLIYILSMFCKGYRVKRKLSSKIVLGFWCGVFERINR
ncbi:glycosyltransferase [Vibrio artabrorum]|uniref:glycosyltransferase n=1 Tax=Vibrio artabrorum TaxID=446374 RepID=UPI0021C2829A|nr:glycosyltransferase [Vibrio artabrorum]